MIGPIKKIPVLRKLSLAKLLLLSGAVLLFGTWYFSLPKNLFPDNYSTVMYDSDGRLLNARVSEDGQWRFPPGNDLPEKYTIALINFEDRYFNYHPGFNPVSFLRASWQNVRSGRKISGGSTLSMQLMRLHRLGKPRTFREKVIEVFLATRLETRYSKKEILGLYASHAPFGGNVVGLQAASWRYFGHGQADLSWAEAAMLAVLPNSPSLIFPGKNHRLLLAKRNRLLDLLHHRGFMDALTLHLAKSEPIPGAPYALPQHAPHLFNRCLNDGLSGQQVFTTIDVSLQGRIESILVRHNNQLRGNMIENVAAIVAEVNSGKVLAYWGNTPGMRAKAHQVDVISSRRSPGSLLKPFLYAAMLEEGLILPRSLVPDIPTHFQGFSPENFARTYDGAVPAARALARSLNVPAVRMLQSYHPEKFLNLMKSCGIHTFNRPASHYGLSLILGGAEVTMWEIAGSYASMARTLNQYDPENTERKLSFHPLYYHSNSPIPIPQRSPFTSATVWHTFDAMVEAARPDMEAFWQRFAGRRNVAWKTGTSYGYRDAWSVGIDSRYVVAVWVGNATGEGRPELTGVAAAAPIMFDIFGLLPSSTWFNKPYEEMREAKICHHSGFPASELCEPTDTLWVPAIDSKTGVCPFHQRIHLDKSLQYRVNTQCEPWSDIVAASWFILPPVQEYYFRTRNPFYRSLPPFRQDCHDLGRQPMQWIYPTETTLIYIPLELDGLPGETVFRIAHQQQGTRLFWHLNENYLGSTDVFHEMAFRATPGKYRMTVIDENGNILLREFEIIGRERQRSF